MSERSRKGKRSIRKPGLPAHLFADRLPLAWGTMGDTATASASRLLADDCQGLRPPAGCSPLDGWVRRRFAGWDGRPMGRWYVCWPWPIQQRVPNLLLRFPVCLSEFLDRFARGEFPELHWCETHVPWWLWPLPGAPFMPPRRAPARLACL